MRAVLDANVLVPILSCDLLLTAARRELFQAIWSPTILEEVTRNIIAINPDLAPERLRARIAAMSNAFPAASLSEWEPVPSAVNEKDQHVLGQRCGNDGRPPSESTDRPSCIACINRARSPSIRSNRPRDHRLTSSVARYSEVRGIPELPSRFPSTERAAVESHDG